MYGGRTNKMSMMHYNMLAGIYRNLITEAAQPVELPDGTTQVCVPVATLLSVMCRELKLDNPRFIDRLFMDAILKGG